MILPDQRHNDHCHHQPGQHGDQDEVDDRHRNQRHKRRIGHAADAVASEGQILHRHITGDGGFLQQGNELVGQGGQHIFQHLGRDDIPHGLHIVQTNGAAGFHLALVDGQNAAAEDFRHIRTGVDAEGERRHRQAIGGGCKHDIVQNQQLHHHGRAADDGGIHQADLIQNAQDELGEPAHVLAVGLPDGADHRHDHADQDADAQRAGSHQQGVFQAGDQHLPAVTHDEVERKLRLHAIKPGCKGFKQRDVLLPGSGSANARKKGTVAPFPPWVRSNYSAASSAFSEGMYFSMMAGMVPSAVRAASASLNLASISVLSLAKQAA